MGQEEKKTAWNLIAKTLAGEASPEDRRELEQLLKNNPELHYPMQTISDLWKSTENAGAARAKDPSDAEAGDPAQAASAEAEAAYTRHLDRLSERQIEFPARRRSGRRRLLVGAVSMLLLLAGIAFLVDRRAPGTTPAASLARSVPAANEIRTANGFRTHLTLPDGTLVWLNAGSRLTYGKNFNRSRREVSLTGEAFFDVAKNDQKPFLIHTNRIDIQVLGTSFNVKSYPSENTTEATLIRGSIEVSIKDRPSERIILKPNQKLVVGSDDSLQQAARPRRVAPAGPGEPLVSIRQPTYERATGAIIETAWVNDKLTFRQETFGELARQMERWYGVNIRFDDPAMEQLEFTGSFKQETVEQAFEALRLTARFDYRIEANQITIGK